MKINYIVLCTASFVIACAGAELSDEEYIRRQQNGDHYPPHQKEVKFVLTQKRKFEPSPQQPSKKIKQDIPQSLEPSHTKSSANTVVTSQKPEDKFLTLFRDIMKNGPYPIEPIIGNIAQNEDQDGSRKWVNFFDQDQNEGEKKSHPWHVSSSKIIKEIRTINHNKQYLPADTNFSLARLTFVLTNGDQKEENIPFFFVSGWPANQNKNSVQNFSKELSERKLGEILKDYKDYGLRFITMSYKGTEEENLRTRRYQPYQQELSHIIEKECSDKNPLISQARLQSHINVLSSTNSLILAKLYFHSEQSLWLYVKEKIEKFKATLKKQSIGDIRSHFEQQLQDRIQYVILDTCSFYDMCWCCGDSLVSCAHTLNFGEKVIIRASGCMAYYDTILSTGSGALRNYQKEFSGFAEGKAYEFEPAYKPYVAHTAVDNLS